MNMNWFLTAKGCIVHAYLGDGLYYGWAFLSGIPELVLAAPREHGVDHVVLELPMLAELLERAQPEILTELVRRSPALRAAARAVDPPPADPA
jgi:hypothetical protein